MVTEENFAALQREVDLINARLQTQLRNQCVETRPHDMMVFQRGANVYLCECGMVYRKDGKGGLLEVV